ncbi:hypothetical protein ACF0H5_003672 [Mactra antiquata]
MEDPKFPPLQLASTSPREITPHCGRADKSVDRSSNFLRNICVYLHASLRYCHLTSFQEEPRNFCAIFWRIMIFKLQQTLYTDFDLV